ncbi:hypothetical protein BJ912DRAFT_1068406 [Pholiota molesta]|nr:hypothetical protein BJ912DRAFT_1068406 [Pholiota molesta]
MALWSPRDLSYAVPFAASSTRGVLFSAVARVPCIAVVVRRTNRNHKAAASFTHSWWIRREGRRRISPALHDAIDVDHAPARASNGVRQCVSVQVVFGRVLALLRRTGDAECARRGQLRRRANARLSLRRNKELSSARRVVSMNYDGGGV